MPEFAYYSDTTPTAMRMGIADRIRYEKQGFDPPRFIETKTDWLKDYHHGWERADGIIKAGKGVQVMWADKVLSS